MSIVPDGWLKVGDAITVGGIGGRYEVTSIEPERIGLKPADEESAEWQRKWLNHEVEAGEP